MNGGNLGMYLIVAVAFTAAAIIAWPLLAFMFVLVSAVFKTFL